MNVSFLYGDQTIRFELIYSRRKTLGIQIEPPDKVIVKSPFGLSTDQVCAIVQKRAAWIIKKLASFRAMNIQPVQRSLINGELYLYLGKEYPLQIIIDKSVAKPSVDLFQDRLVVITPTIEKTMLQKALIAWYKVAAATLIEERIRVYAHCFSLSPVEVKVKEQKRRWGSCTAQNHLLFNWRIVMAPLAVLDYVVVHEMSHLVHKNHGKDYWNLVASILPDFKKRKEWLKYNALRMEI
ncbi:M48 family metallopeptidase [Heliophilum fasciatum]|uniref:YgjP-like metallopeptidase domain-containing protein n=1 Tax=Heliophilum fasciatum TaxID=35700 RepID=A0A4R2REY7_9FIRM|nr:SprT family zinc-dependent metalloprotease [Heliophilum fasciatum]MCW2279189.1 putative metal-dependent hydrolase [Heliophilum fasciatum]TCP60978.1 hypothetical protein EDD73_1324 [Heliophilum fasciatum]